MEMNEDIVLTVTITVSEYEQLVRDSECLRVLQSVLETKETMMSDTDIFKCICGMRKEVQVFVEQEHEKRLKKSPNVGTSGEVRKDNRKLTQPYYKAD